ncbi:hypothetical protein ADUPG1_011465 [Aduncisulcus paluster]|uniref:Polyprotein n=1 Tax=Aduncisulcus paluster TaxID=2918883 RepID=A0ABQ5K0Q3_9EUKA|nr:hypothetical protein ADUPG1_011465 [Aduncisulcus paluster]
MLVQLRQGKEEVVMFLSKKFTEVERRWSTMEQEAYAIYYAIKKLQQYLLGRSFVVETDHKNLLYLHKEPAAKVIRWKMFLMQFNFSLRHIPGVENVVADALSRAFDDDKKMLKVVTEVPEELDEDVQWWKDSYKQDVIRDEDGWICLDEVPREILKTMVKDLHNRSAAHMGRVHLVDYFKKRQWRWKKMREVINIVIQSCPVCQKLTKQRSKKLVGTLAAFKPFDSISVDTLGPLEVRETYRYIAAHFDPKVIQMEQNPVFLLPISRSYFGTPL